MEVIYGIIPGMLILGLVALGVFFWAARSGQFDDMEGDARRILMDEDPPLTAAPDKKTASPSSPSGEGEATKEPNAHPSD